MRQFKKLIDLKNLVKGLIFIRIRNLGEFQTYGHNTENDNDTHYVADHIMGNEHDKIKEKRLINLIQISRQDEKLLQLFDLFRRIENLIDSAAGRKSKSSEFNPKTTLILDIENHSFRIIKKTLRKFIKPDLNEVIDRSTFKIAISLKETISFITLITPLIFSGGYLYNSILFGLYGIDTSLYFGLSDYISVTINQIRFAIIGGIFALFGFFRSVVDINVNIGYFRNKYNIKRKENKRTVFNFLLLSVFAVLSYLDIKHSFLFVFALLFLFFDFLLGKYVLPYVEGSFKNLSVLLFISVFFALVISSSITDYLNNKNENVKVIFHDDTLNQKFKDYQIITMTSNYIFLTKDETGVKIIKRELIDYFESQKEKPPSTVENEN